MNQKKIKVGTGEIQEEAVKCRCCGGSLAGPPSKPEVPWYARTSILILAFLTVGPLALPLVWFHPVYSQRKKIIVTLIVLAISCVLVLILIRAVQTLFDLYKQAGIF